ncbi:MAG: penicillin-binding protein [Deltaproteobacteria bacterium]|nr:penicillin-binding protein [Deltaproteobacteria bacterium]
MGRRETKKAKKLVVYLLFFAAVTYGFVIFIAQPSRSLAPQVTKVGIATSLEASLNENLFPKEIEIQVGLKKEKLQPTYHLDLLSQHQMEKVFQQYKPDYGAFVAVDATTGAILSLVSYTRERKEMGNLVLKATFPAASIFKVVTAVAAIDQKKAKPDTIVPYTGSNHTLYKRNLSQKMNPRWARHVTLREAFARSINSVFGKVGLYILKPHELNEYAKRFQFNQAINADVPVQPGTFYLEENDEYKVAEAASGFTRVAQMSPLQGALMAASIVNDGIMMEPHLVSELKKETGEVVYKAEIKELGQVMEPESARNLRELMRETVVRGTSQKSFRDLLRKKKLKEVEMGGKTGHLTGLSPKGNYDWFVGYATDGKKKIALAALTINEDTWRVKASYVARQFFEKYFKTVVASGNRP